MREARRKSVDPTAQEYLLKARQEGIKLSWDSYSLMQSQDRVDSLGLSCYDCLQGPCSLNNLESTGERTICGLTGRELVYRGIQRLISKYYDPSWEADGLTCGCEDNTSLINLAQIQVMKLGNVKNLGTGRMSTKAGLGVLRQEYVNVCLEGLSATLTRAAYELMEELKAEAIGRGAKGFNLVQAGDVATLYPIPSVSNMGGVETALLTGIVDLYVIGADGLGLGRNVAPHYHTVVGEADTGTCRHKMRKWLIQASEAFSRRDETKIKTADQLRNIPIFMVDHDQIMEQLRRGNICGICILGGGNNIKITQDKLISEAAVRIGSKDILCLTYGNTAVTLGKYGFLEEAEGVSDCPGGAPGLNQGTLAYCVGTEKDAAVILALVQSLESNVKVVALFPELATSWDLLVALALAGAGARVLTTTKLPLAGSQEAAEEIGKLITYCEVSEYTDQALRLLGRG